MSPCCIVGQFVDLFTIVKKKKQYFVMVANVKSRQTVPQCIAKGHAVLPIVNIYPIASSGN